MKNPRGPSGVGWRLLPRLVSLLLLTLAFECLALAIETGRAPAEASEQATIISADDFEGPGIERHGRGKEVRDLLSLRGLLRPATTRTLTACTTMVIANFSAAACSSYSSPGPGCTFTFRDQDVRQLYDCNLVKYTGALAGAYIDTPPEGLLSIGTLAYHWDTGLAGGATPRQVTMTISALNASCGTIKFAGPITPSARRRSLLYSLKPGAPIVKSQTGAMSSTSIRSVKISSTGFKAQSTSDPSASGFTVVPISVTISYASNGPNLPIPLDCSTNQTGLVLKNITVYKPNMIMGSENTLVSSWIDVFVENRYPGLVTNLVIDVATNGTLSIYKLEIPDELTKYIQASQSGPNNWVITMPRVPPGLAEALPMRAIFNSRGRMTVQVTATATYQQAPAVFSGLPYTVPRVIVYAPCEGPCSSHSDCCYNYYCDVDMCKEATVAVTPSLMDYHTTVRLQGDAVQYTLTISNHKSVDLVTDVVVEFAGSGAAIINMTIPYPFLQTTGVSLSTSAPWRLFFAGTLDVNHLLYQDVSLSLENKAGPFSITATAVARSNGKLLDIQKETPYQSPTFTTVPSCASMACSNISQCCPGYECKTGVCSVQGKLQLSYTWAQATVKSGGVATLEIRVSSSYSFDWRDLSLTLSTNGSAGVSSLVASSYDPYVAPQIPPWTFSVSKRRAAGNSAYMTVEVITDGPGTLSLTAAGTAFVIPKSGPEVAVTLAPKLSPTLTVEPSTDSCATPCSSSATCCDTHYCASSSVCKRGGLHVSPSGQMKYADLTVWGGSVVAFHLIVRNDYLDFSITNVVLRVETTGTLGLLRVRCLDVPDCQWARVSESAPWNITIAEVKRNGYYMDLYLAFDTVPGTGTHGVSITGTAQYRGGTPAIVGLPLNTGVFPK